MNYSPMMMQYLQTKENYKDCILLYRLGDFYEMFFEDAQKGSEILDLVLTGRDCGNGQRAPMCGVPYHAVDNYVAKLVAAGVKVAICEQLTEPNGKDMVERGVVRVITAGTLMDSSMLDEKANNFIASLCSDESGIGCAVCDVSTGMFVSEQWKAGDFKRLQEFLVSFKPSEVISDTHSVVLNAQLDCIKAGYIPKITTYFDWAFDFDKAKAKIMSHYRVATLDGFGISSKKYVVRCSGALLEYLADTQKREMSHLLPIHTSDSKEFMSIDVKTRRNLELTVSSQDKRKGSLLWLLDKTSTSMGARTLANWIERPLQNAKQINARLGGVEELFCNYSLRDTLGQLLSGVKDVERLAGKISYNSVSPKDCNTLCQSLENVPKIKALLSKCKSEILLSISDKIVDVSQVKDLLAKAVKEDAPILTKDGGYIKDGFNAELDEWRNVSRNGKKMIADLESFERERSGIKTLKLGYNKIFGYYFEISKGLADNAPDYFIRKQTLVNGERFVSPELKELEEKILTADDKLQSLEKSLFSTLRDDLLVYIPDLQKIAYCVSVVDCLLSLARVASANNYCKPKINVSDSALNIVDGRHPIVETYIKRENFIANDTLLDTKENRTMILTGPNMAGKSTYMRQVALIVLMAHIGSFVPAASATVPIVDKIFTRVGASDDLSFNQSTFMVEMVEVANILNNATSKSLLVLDEIGRGTSTFDGLSIAWSVMEYLSSKIGAKTLFATHFHELTELEGRVDGVKNYRVTVKEYNGGVIFLHKIARGGANKSFGVEVASLAGVPAVVCDRAKEIVKMLENSDINLKIENFDVSEQRLRNNKTANEIVTVLKDVDVNRIAPIEAFDILCDLVKRVKE